MASSSVAIAVAVVVAVVAVAEAESTSMNELSLSFELSWPSILLFTPSAPDRMTTREMKKERRSGRSSSSKERGRTMSNESAHTNSRPCSELLNAMGLGPGVMSASIMRKGPSPDPSASVMRRGARGVRGARGAGAGAGASASVRRNPRSCSELLNALVSGPSVSASAVRKGAGGEGSKSRSRCRGAGVSVVPVRKGRRRDPSPGSGPGP